MNYLSKQPGTEETVYNLPGESELQTRHLNARTLEYCQIESILSAKNVSLGG
jgi:hypothetical protein